MNFFSKHNSTGFQGARPEDANDMLSYERTALREWIKVYQATIFDIRKRLAAVLSENKSEVGGSVAKEAAQIVSEIDNLMGTERSKGSMTDSIAESPSNVEGGTSSRSRVAPHLGKRTNDRPKFVSPFETYSRTSQYLSPLQSSTHQQSTRRVKKLKRN